MDPFDPYPNLGTLRSDSTEYEHLQEEASVGTDTDTKDVLAEKEKTREFPLLFAMTILGVLILGLRLVNLQVIQGSKNRVLAEGNRVRTREIRAPRGEIQDRNGVVLASSTAAYSLEIYPAELPRKSEDRESVFVTVESVTGISLDEVRSQLKDQGLMSLNAMPIASQIDRETALLWKIRLLDLPGINLIKVPQRTYEPIPGIGHILGYVGRVSEEDKGRWPDLSLATQVGKTGIEISYESFLQGKPGGQRIEVDAKGRVERILSEIDPVQGDTVRLTIDSRFQTSLANNLQNLSEKRQVTNAAAVAMNPKNGEILAMVSLPGFDPTVFVNDNQRSDRAALLTDEKRPLLNRVIAGVYPSGSTIKPVVAAAALSEGVISAQTKLDTSSGVIQIGEWRFPDWKVHGITDVRRAIAESNDIFFYALGGGYDQISGLGAAKLKDWLNRFGFGRLTGIDVPGEVKGLVPDDAWKRNRFKEAWYIGDSYHLAIGQGFFLSTPLQLAAATVAIANGGTNYQPHLLKERQAPGSSHVDIVAPKIGSDHVATTDILKVVREGMRQTVTDGTARSLGELPLPAAGKTGTAQFGQDEQTHSWFVGFAPYDDPQIVVAILVEGGGESSDAAVPVAKGFLRDWMEVYQIEKK